MARLTEMIVSSLHPIFNTNNKAKNIFVYIRWLFNVEHMWFKINLWKFIKIFFGKMRLFECVPNTPYYIEFFIVLSLNVFLNVQLKK